MKSINIDRVLVLEKFLIDYMTTQEENAVARLNDSLVPFELKIAQLKSVVPLGYDELIENYWRDLKRSTTPGLRKACLPDNYDAGGLAKSYKLMMNVRGCVPYLGYWEKPFLFRESIVDFTLGVFIIGSMFGMFPFSFKLLIALHRFIFTDLPMAPSSKYELRK
uniref:Anoctamin n=1 Tax=Steinernema glaseri TaxID=37863 RepID=A0A1I7Y5C9_9BILA